MSFAEKFANDVCVRFLIADDSEADDFLRQFYLIGIASMSIIEIEDGLRLESAI